MDDPRLSAEGELALARLAISDGDLTHAAGHVAGAIAYAPTMPEVHEILAQLAARTSGGLDLFPLDQHAFVGTVVARAHLLAAAGAPAEGLELLAAATGYAPSADWAGVPWVNAPGLAGRLDADRLARILMRICAVTPDPVPAPDQQPLRPYLRLAGHAVDAHPEHGLLLGAASALARRLGEIDLAVDWARRGTRTSATKLAEVWLGYAYRSAGRTDEALAALHRAVAHDPDDLSVYADIAGTLADNGRLDEALRWIDRALARDPTFDCAVHTGHRLRFQRDGALAHLVALADYQRDHPDDSHEHTDLAECCQGSPWLGQLPAASEAVANALRQFLADRPGGDDAGSRADGRPRTGDGRSSGGRGRIPAQGRLRLSGLESPSAMRTLAGAAPGLVVTVAEAPEPDIRRPRRASEHQLWRYDGMVAAPAVRPPSATAVERIRQLAYPAWAHPPAAYDGAVGLATLDLDDLLGLLTHPPDPPPTTLGRALAEHDPTLWVRCVQVWACLGLLHHRTDEPWATSTRRQVLVDLVWGVEDWTTEAALFALVTYAWVDPAARADVARVAADRLVDGMTVARDRPVSIIRSLAQLVLATPAMAPAMVAATQLVFAASEPDRGGPGPLARLWLRLTRRFRRAR
jgi:tetratricopeptide (TPR) repeat protein